MELSLNKIKGYRIGAFISFLSAVTPGFLFIYIFNKHLFLSLDYIKLLSLSISISLPIIGFNTICVYMALNKKNEYDYTKLEKARLEKLIKEKSPEQSEEMKRSEELEEERILAKKTKNWNRKVHFTMTESIFMGGWISSYFLSIICVDIGYLNKGSLINAVHIIIALEASTSLLAYIIANNFIKKTNRLISPKS